VKSNKLSKGQKAAALGTLVVAGGVGAYFLLRPSSASAQTNGGGGGTLPGGGGGGGVPIAACEALYRDKLVYAGSARPDPTLLAQKEAALAECLRQAEEGGAEIPAFLGRLSEADEIFVAINGKFQEYKNTEYSDALKRNNIRNEMVRKGGEMATKYVDAAEAAANDAEAQGARQSVLRAFDAAMTRRLCYLYDQAGCGRYGLNEPHGNKKAEEVQTRVIDKLMTAHTRAAVKLGGPGRERIQRGSDEFLRIMLRPCEALRAHLAQQFIHYKRTSYSDALKRNNTRMAILAGGASLANCVRANFDTAKTFNNTNAVRNVARVTEAALRESIARWICYKDDQTGCGRFALNEDHGNKKADQEKARVMDPLFSAYAAMASHLRSKGDSSLYPKLASMRITLCNAMKARIDREFTHYKRTSYSDAIKRNNTRQTMLSTGTALAQCLAAALREAAGIRNAVKAVSDSALGALDAAMTRKLCYKHDQSGCGRFGVNEDHGNKKASDIQGRVIDPLTTVARAAANALAGFGDQSADARLAQILARECIVLRDFVNTKFLEYKRVSYTDAIRRNNLRQVVLSNGRAMVACFGRLRPTTAAGKRVVKDAISTALAQSRSREACYRAGSSGCGRFALNEDDNAKKARDEAASIRQPLEALLGSSALRGLGSTTTGSNAPLFILGAAGLAALVYMGS
jgi:hypothetical protein